MRKGLSIILVAFLAVVIAYSGSGINLYFFCCNDCRTENYLAVLSGHCCEKAAGRQKSQCHHSPAKEAKQCCSTPAAQDANEPQTSCKVERITVNWQPDQSEKRIAGPQSFNLLSDLIRFIQNSYEPVYYINPWQYVASQKPPNLSANVYFSLLNVLLI